MNLQRTTKKASGRRPALLYRYLEYPEVAVVAPRHSDRTEIHNKTRTNLWFGGLTNISRATSKNGIQQPRTVQATRTSMDGLTLSSNVMERFDLAAFRSDHSAGINSLDFNATGSLLITAGNDEIACLYNPSTAELKKTLYCKKYGIAHVSFVPTQMAQVLHASRNGWDDTIRLWDIEHGAYLQYFSGHRSVVTSLSLDSSGFASASLDGHIRLWDYRERKCTANIRDPSLQAPITVKLDPQSTGLWTFTQTGHLVLYDTRFVDAGPAVSWPLTAGLKSLDAIEFVGGGKFMHCWGGTADSKDGVEDSDRSHGYRSVLLSTLDASILQTWDVPEQAQVYTIEQEWFVSGNKQGKLQMHRLSQPEELQWESNRHSCEVTGIGWCPSMMRFVSADKNGGIAFWGV